MTKHESAAVRHARDYDEGVEKLVRAEQLDTAIRLAPMPIIIFSVILQFIVWVFFEPRYQNYFVTLELVTLSLATQGLRFCLRWSRGIKPDEISSDLLRQICVFGAVCGLTIGSIPPMVYVDAGLEQRLLVAATVTGLIGTSMTLSVMPPLALSFFLPIVVACFATLAATGETYSIYVAFLLAAYTIFLSFLTLFFSRLVKKHVVAQANLEREQTITTLLLNDFEENANDWLWETDGDLRLQHVSDRLAQVSGLARQELKKITLDRLFATAGDAAVSDAERLWQSINTKRAFRDIILPVEINGEQRWWLVSGKPILINNSGFAGYRGVGADITLKKQAEDRLSYLVLHDALTDLPNRISFQQSLSRAIAELRNDEPFALFCLDLDEFKAVNDTMGHGAGDKLLQAVGKRFSQCLGPGPVLARLAGDEFAVLLRGPQAQDRNALEALSDRLIAAIGQPFQIDDRRVNIGVSLGIAVAPEDGSSEIMRRADLALCQSKRQGKNRYRFYRADMDEQLTARRQLTADMQNGLERNEFALYFQPLVCAATRKIQGFEALLRWTHPTRGSVLPMEFIPLAEESGFIVRLGKWIIEEACRIAVTWPSAVSVAVNISPLQLRHSNLPEIVAAALEQYGLPSHRLELELTESVFLESTESTQKILQQLGELGVRLSLDDFGTGYSSLSYLRRITFNKIKIDQSFVRNLPQDQRDMSIVRAIVDIATTIGVATIAEGVETEEQRICLLQQGCHQLQGYLFSKPVPADQVPAMLESATSEADTIPAKSTLRLLSA